MIAVEGLCVRAGAFLLEDIRFEVPEGGYGVLMGRTGCGKTTLLETLCGLRRAEAGRIVLGGRDVTGLPPAERGVGYVPQDRALFSTFTVREHLAFALRLRGRPEAEIERRVAELAGRLGLKGLLDRRPAGLSGGEAQRVALGRALAPAPRILILDEPLTALDEETREEMFALLEDVRRGMGVTTLHVTHSREEALRLGDRLFAMEAGRLRAIGREALKGEEASA